MSIPLDRLYNYIEGIANKVYGDVIIYRFWPHGSKKLEDLRFLHDRDYYTIRTLPPVVCHDQEPLNYDHYQNYEWSLPSIQLRIKYNCYEPLNLERPSIFDQTVLIHSEQCSTEVEKYQLDGRFVTVYYWSHALIALDWFRFAQYTQQRKQVKKPFLIYNRAWAGTREYRVKFCELLLEHDLVDDCQITFNCVDPDTGLHYDQALFENPVWKPKLNLDNVFVANTKDSNSSADFEIDDYESTDIEVVLETLFDDTRLHLTEKTLRPIACGQPFVVVGTPGSLKYLQNYGFKTYAGVWDESYDNITDPYQRLLAIIKLMKTIASWDSATRHQKLCQAQTIADHNKKHFFSQHFFDQVESELSANLQTALHQSVDNNTSSKFLNFRKKNCRHDEIKNIMIGRAPSPDQQFSSFSKTYQESIFKTSELMKVLQTARKYNSRK